MAVAISSKGLSRGEADPHFLTEDRLLLSGQPQPFGLSTGVRKAHLIVWRNPYPWEHVAPSFLPVPCSSSVQVWVLSPAGIGMQAGNEQLHSSSLCVPTTDNSRELCK